MLGESATVGNTRGGGNHATAGSGTATPSTASTFDATNVTPDSATKTSLPRAKWLNKQQGIGSAQMMAQVILFVPS